MINKDLKFLVIGLGSIGERHVRNLKTLGYTDITVLRSRNLPPRTLAIDDYKTVLNWDDAVANDPDLAIICTPTSMHQDQAIKCLESGISVLVEKPISNDLSGEQKIKSLIKADDSLFCYTAYMMRFHPFVAKIKSIIDAKTYGALRSFHSQWGEHLPYWHPWEDYSETYAALNGMGGGAALTLSHDIDLAMHLMPSKVSDFSIFKNDKTALKTDTDDATDVMFRFENGATGHVHVNFFQKNPQRRYEYRFDGATVIFDYFSNEMTILKDKDKETISYDGFDRNDMFIEQSKFVIAQLKNPTFDRMFEIEQAYFTTKICLS